MNARALMSRREFVAVLGAGGAMLIGTVPAFAAHPVVDAGLKTSTHGAQEFTPWLSIAPDGTVTVMVTTPDIGNGVVTQALAYVYEELGVPWESLRGEYASANRNYRMNGFYSNVAGPLSFFSGRSTVRARRITYMTAAAGARERLKAAAAGRWGVPASQVEARDGLVHHTGSGRSIPFGELLAAASRVALLEEPTPKPREQWTFLGKSTPSKVQIPAIATGTLVYGMDARPPGMVYAALRQSPVVGGRLKRFDFEAIRHLPGVRAAVEIKPSDAGEHDKITPPFPLGATATQSAVAVIADHYWQARTALDALPVEWDDGPGAKWKNTEMMNQAALAALGSSGGKVEFSQGDADAELAKGGRIVEARYLTPYCEQMPMEPLNGTALVTADRVELWHPSQHPQMAFCTAVQQTGVSPENVTVHQTFVGGGFGRRVFSDDVRMVVAVAQQYPGVPVHTIWSREEATRQGRYRPLLAAHLTARLGEDGLPAALVAHLAGGPDFFSVGMSDTALPRVVQSSRVESHVVRDFHILTGPYRGPGYNSNTFFVESFVDELAAAVRVDPLEYRMRLYGKWADPGWVKVLQELKDKSGWGSPLSPGHARGVAVSNWGMEGRPRFGTTTGAVVHAEVNREGRLIIHRIDVAFDSGRVLNRDAVLAELQGGTIFGLNMALNEELNIQNGRIVEGNFDQYRMLRTGDIPEIHVHFGGLTDHDRYDEIGETPVGPVGPALANAIFAITGQRLRTQPLRKHDLRAS